MKKNIDKLIQLAAQYAEIAEKLELPIGKHIVFSGLTLHDDRFTYDKNLRCSVWFAHVPREGSYSNGYSVKWDTQLLEKKIEVTTYDNTISLGFDITNDILSERIILIEDYLKNNLLPLIKD